MTRYLCELAYACVDLNCNHHNPHEAEISPSGINVCLVPSSCPSLPPRRIRCLIYEDKEEEVYFIKKKEIKIL
jgi:hypothetical protein